jgi:hypothetical protein
LGDRHYRSESEALCPPGVRDVVAMPKVVHPTIGSFEALRLGVVVLDAPCERELVMSRTTCDAG